MNELLESLKKTLLEGLAEIFPTISYRVILYGSYARGEYDEESDLDIMVIADIEESEKSLYRQAVNRLADRLSLQYAHVVSLLLVPEAKFRRYDKIMPLYIDVMREGQVLNV
ncbi:MAG: nucleotidyltransferase domain-containing protein [Planctomycetia bacterium]|nr:nucleotidyltransferase domain-containing protein [Planctomycetia bacterium]